MKAPGSPRFLHYVLQAILDLEDAHGSTMKEILGQLKRTHSVNSSRRLNTEVKKALKSANVNGIVSEEAGKFSLVRFFKRNWEPIVADPRKSIFDCIRRKRRRRHGNQHRRGRKRRGKRFYSNRKASGSPRLLSYVLQAILNLGDIHGSTTKKILGQLKSTYSGSSNRRLTTEVKKALKYALDNGLVRERAGRFTVRSCKRRRRNKGDSDQHRRCKKRRGERRHVSLNCLSYSGASAVSDDDYENNTDKSLQRSRSRSPVLTRSKFISQRRNRRRNRRESKSRTRRRRRRGRSEHPMPDDKVQRKRDVLHIK